MAIFHARNKFLECVQSLTTLGLAAKKKKKKKKE
jgi:hypothetical protein